MNISRKRYIQGFCIAVVVLGMVRCIFPSVAGDMPRSAQTQTPVATTADSTQAADTAALLKGTLKAAPISQRTRFFNADGTPARNRIFSVPNFGNTFPDQNDVQLAAAQRHGVKAVLDRKDAERRKSELVYVGNNPFFHVDRLNNSIPYLVPSASELLQDIGRAFFDSLQTKQIPLHKIIVTSVLRSKADVAKLRQHNSNATVCYNRYKTVEDPQGPRRRQVRNDSLKWVLSEVLNDMRQQKRCLVKYEVKQGCFHITVN